LPDRGSVSHIVHVARRAHDCRPERYDRIRSQRDSGDRSGPGRLRYRHPGFAGVELDRAASFFDVIADRLFRRRIDARWNWNLWSDFFRGHPAFARDWNSHGAGSGARQHPEVGRSPRYDYDVERSCDWFAGGVRVNPFDGHIALWR